ncbi:MAG: hypothetical protein AAF065_15405 [Verrucomicrobiota bacterium]
MQTSVDNGDSWQNHLDIEPPYLDELFGYTSGFAGSRTLTDVNPSDSVNSLLELDARVVSVVDNNYTATVTVRADIAGTSEEMRVVVVPQDLSNAEQFMVDVFTALGVYTYQGDGILPEADFDGDTISNIAELQLGFDPTDAADPAVLPTPLEVFVAAQFAELGVLGTLEVDNSVTPPANIAPTDNFDSDTFNNAIELLAGFDPNDDTSEPVSPSLELSVAQAWLALGTFNTDGPVENFLPYQDFDGDGIDNVTEFAIAGRSPANPVDVLTPTALEEFVADVFTDPVPSDDSIIPDNAGEGYALFGDPLLNIGPLEDYDADGTSNIAEILRGANPTLDNDAGTISNLEEFTAEGMAQFDVFSLPAPANIEPNSNLDSDLVSNVLELMLGFDPTDGTSGPATNTLAYDVAEELVLTNAFDFYDVADFGPFDDLDGDGFSNIAEQLLFDEADDPASQPSEIDAYTAEEFALLNVFFITINYNATDDFDGDGTSNIAELQLGRDPSSAADINTTTVAEDIVAEVFAVTYGLYDPAPADIGPTDDFDTDGFSNIAEIQVGTNPTNGSNFPDSESEAALFEAFAAEGVIVGEELNGELVDALDLEPTADFDEDGESNLLELALGGNVADFNVQTEALSAAMAPPNFTLTFVRLKASETPNDLEIIVECSTTVDGVYAAVAPGDIVSDTAAADQTGLPSSDYERVEVTIDTTTNMCGFFRIAVEQTP